MTGYDEFLRRVPKVELHCHFEGTVRPGTFADLARKHGVELPTDDVDAVCASAEKPRLPARLPASRGSAPAPLSIVRRVRAILVPSSFSIL